MTETPQSRRKFLTRAVAVTAGAATLGALEIATSAPAQADPVGQGGWWYCIYCKGLHYNNEPDAVPGRGRCPQAAAPGSPSRPFTTHELGNSYAYYLHTASAVLVVPYQTEWRYCRKCSGLAYAYGYAGVCPAGGVHDHTNSFNYAIVHTSGIGQDNWRYCNECRGLYYGPLQLSSYCPAGGPHISYGSLNYRLPYTT